MYRRLDTRETLQVLGLMSGTSLDGLDLCLAEVSNRNGQVDATVKYFASYAFDADYREMLARVIARGGAEDICRANFDTGRQYMGLIERFLDSYSIQPDKIDLIGSHGQTIWHIDGHSTLQIGEASLLAEALQLPVISDFRVRDIAAGGSGAPLVPFVDYLIFRKYQKNLLVLNIGGIANFTIIPRKAHSVADIYALDSGPGNSLIDIAVTIYTGGKKTFDEGGCFARQGRIRRKILTELMAHPYISRPCPKSTGREVFGREMVIQLIEQYRIEANAFPDLIATLTRFTAEAIYDNYRRFFRDSHPLDELVISGGGAQNPVIVKHLKNLFQGVKIANITEYGIPAGAKEALAFAILAACRVWDIPGNVPNVTGADHPVVLGKLTV